MIDQLELVLEQISELDRAIVIGCMVDGSPDVAHCGDH
jgi:hypothetical protein